MPTIRLRVTATTDDALANVKFAEIGGKGAIINVWVASATAGDTYGLSIGNQELVVQGTRPNVESAAGVIDIFRDQVLYNEVVPPGRLYLPIGAVTTEVLAKIDIRYL